MLKYGPSVLTFVKSSVERDASCIFGAFSVCVAGLSFELCFFCLFGNQEVEFELDTFEKTDSVNSFLFISC